MRIGRAQAILDHLAKQGIEIDLDEVRAEAHFGSIGRPHIASILIKKQWVHTFQEAFNRYLSDLHLGDFRPAYPALEEVLALAEPLRFCPVLAHPGTRFTIQELAQFKQQGLKGLEVLHPSHGHRVQQLLADYCQELGFLATGGSDFHGTKATDSENFGTFTLSEELTVAFLAGLKHLQIDTDLTYANH